MKTYRNFGVIFFLVFTSQLLMAQERETGPVFLERISENVYQIEGGSGANGGVIIGENGVVVIDSKMNEESVLQAIRAIGEVTDLPIKYLVNTHSDGDHIMGNRYFPGSATIIAHEICRDDFFKENFGRASDWGEPRFYPFTPSITFKESMNVWLGKDKVELYYFGAGHTTGDIIVYFPEEKIAFIGDLYFSNRPQLIHSVKNGNSFEYVQTMTKMLEALDAETFLSGHSDPVGRSDIERHIQAMVTKQKKVEELIRQDLDLEEALEQFDENEARLVTSIYNELTGE